MHNGEEMVKMPMKKDFFREVKVRTTYCFTFLSLFCYIRRYIQHDINKYECICITYMFYESLAVMIKYYLNTEFRI